MADDVRQALGGLAVSDLKALAALLGRRGLQRKPELVETLAGLLLDAGRLRAEVDRLDPLERAALAEAVHAWGGRYDRQRMVAKYGREPSWRDGARLRLFFPGGCVPADMRRLLAGMLAPPRAAQLAGTAELPDGDASDDLVVRERETAAQADLLAVLRLCQAGLVRCSAATRRPLAAAVAAITEVLRDGDFYPLATGVAPIAAFAWPLLLQAGGLAELAGNRLQLTALGLAALDAPAADTLRHLWRRWLAQGLIDEFSRIEAIKGQQSGGGRALTAVGPRRQAVAAGLAGCPAGRWVAVDDFFAYLRAEGYDPEVARDPWRLYIGDPEYGSLGYDGCHDWELLQGRYTLCLLFEYAATLGLIDVAYGPPAYARDDFHGNWGTDDLPYLSRYDGLRHFRLNDLGAYILGRAGSYRPRAASPVPEPALRVLPDLEVVVVGPRPVPADALVLDAFAERTGPGRWRLRRERVLAALAAGRTVAELRAFLTARGAGDLPQTVASLLADVAERAARLRDLGLVRLVECEDEALALLLAGDRRLRDLCRRVGERHLAVPVACEGAFRRGLLRLGYVLTGAAVARGSVRA